MPALGSEMLKDCSVPRSTPLFYMSRDIFQLERNLSLISNPSGLLGSPKIKGDHQMSVPIPSYFAIIPANVRYCKELEPSAKLLYGEITALTHKEGYCWASDQYFADLYQVNISTIQRWIKSLKEHQFIIVDSQKVGMLTTRKLWLCGEIKKSFTNTQKCVLEPSKMRTRIRKNEGQIVNTNIKEKETPIVPKRDLPSSSTSRKRIPEEKKEMAPRVLISDSQHEALLRKANQDQALVQSWYEKLSDWKLGKAIFGGANDFKSITNWVIDAVKEAPKSQSEMKEEYIEKNRALAKKIQKKYPHKTDIIIGESYIEFDRGPMLRPHIKFSDNGFEEQVFKNLRAMNILPEEL